MWLVLEKLCAAIADHQANLVKAFARFNDDGSSGLSFDEFEQLLDWCGGAAAENLKPNDKLKLFEQIESKADGDGDEDENDDINDPVAFACVIVRSSCPLSFPRNCRDYWRNA